MSRWAFAASFGVIALWSAGAGAEQQCRASRDLLDLNNPLEIARTAVAEEHQLRIVAMGSSSTQGYGASNPKYSYPAQLQMKLEAAMPGVDVHVYNKGVGGQDAPEMVDRMRADVKPERAHLVVWQVGTNSAIRRDPLPKFAEKLRAGIDIGQALGANFVMMNLQYVPAVVALPDEEQYARVMAEVAEAKRAPACSAASKSCGPGTTTGCPTRSSSPTTACISTTSARNASASCCRRRSSRRSIRAD